jgi:hypothetical protein
MKQPVTFKHEFVQFIPEDLQEGTVYVSIRFATVSHLCACGCKSKVVTPLKPTDWKLTFDGKTISLHPSIGNWNFSCRSHYWIRNNRVQWAEAWSQSRIDAGRTHDRQSKKKYFGGEEAVDETATHVWSSDTTVPSSPASPKRSWWRSLWPW